MKKVVDFLTALKDNNNREWFAAHKAEYEAARGEFEAFIEPIIAGVESFDPAIRDISPRSTMYRINRDTRFSHDKTPYKTYFSSFISEGGRNGLLAGYYFHVEPAGSGMFSKNLICAGIYCPQSAILRSIREEMEFASPAFMMALERAASEGLEVNRENVLSRVPMGFPKDSPMAEYLRLKDVSVYRFFDNDLLLSPNLDKVVLRAFEATYPFVAMINRAAKLCS